MKGKESKTTLVEEKIVKEKMNSRYVWYFFVAEIGKFFIFIAVILVAGISSLTESINVSVQLISTIIILAAVVIVTLSYIWAKLVYHFYAFEFRQYEFRRESGVITKKYVSIPYNRIQNVNVERNLLDRMLGLSRLVIQTAGNTGIGSGEGKLPGLSKERAESVRSELIELARIAHERSDQGI